MSGEGERGRADSLDARVRSGETDPRVLEELRSVLRGLERTDHGLRFRYIPAGSFSMGSDEGDADERPVHQVRQSAFWIADTPLAWTDFCRLMDWQPPPVGLPHGDPPEKMAWFALYQENKIRLQYCEDETRRASDWHRHYPGAKRSLFRAPDRPDVEFRYAKKPMVAVGWGTIGELRARLSTEEWSVDVPTEAQWERAARGLLAGAPYPWGRAAATSQNCDCDAFQEFRILPSRAFAPNDYGLYAMSGSVWEWCRDRYDPEFYAASPAVDPCCERGGERVVRGGSWSDCPEACTVSFRMSRPEDGPDSPNLGVRLALFERS